MMKTPSFFLQRSETMMSLPLFFFFLLAGCSEITKSSCCITVFFHETFPSFGYESVVSKIEESHQAVTLQQSDDKVVMYNGIVSVTVSRPDGNLVGVSYNGIANLLEPRNPPFNRGYWDFSWNPIGYRSYYYRFKGTTFSVLTETEDQAEVSFSYTWNSSSPAGSIPMNIDIRYVLRRGSSGLYSYAILERSEDFPAIRVDVFRLAYKLSQERFHYMAITDDRQREMPTAQDRAKGQTLDYPEAVLLTNPSNPQFLGEVDDKYMYSVENKDNKVSGWVSFNSTNSSSVGLWMITPSNEFRNGGPTKQSLTCHVGPVTLNSFVSPHYAGKDISMSFQGGETYKKVFGPTFLYLNTVPNPRDSQTLWQDAKSQMQKEVESWPYDFPESEAFVPSNQRGKVSGQLLIRWYNISITSTSVNVGNAFVGLALPGVEGSWQTESKGYQFWTQADGSGTFTIQNVVPGRYSLYAWVPGILGDYKYESDITIKPGDAIELGQIYYWPPRNGPTVWEIGIPDRSAQEFYVPDPYPNLINNLYIGKTQDRFRQFGLWKRYTELYPTNDLVYHVGVSHYSKDWFYAQVPRKQNGTYISTTWEIRFELPLVTTGSYTLHIALASATNAHLTVWFNKGSDRRLRFNTGIRGEDNAIARHGIHGLCWRYSFQVPSYLLLKGTNSIHLTQPKAKSQFDGIMYDYIRFESPSS